MSTQIADLQKQIDLLMEDRRQRGQDTDPVGNTVAAIQAHLDTRVTMLPLHDVSDLVKRAGEFTPGNLNPDNTAAFTYAIERFVSKNGPVAHEFAYIRDLAGDLHQFALDAKAKSVEIVQVEDEEKGSGED